MPPKKEKLVKEPMKKGRKSEDHLSTFLITINPNQLKKDNVKLLKKSIEKFYDNIEDFIKNQSSNVKIKNISCDSSIEKGSKRLAFHSHLLVRCIHTGKILMNLQKMREFFDKEIPLGDEKNVYIQVKFVSDPSFTIGQKYFGKEK